jgi:uncharacterized membrane protein
MATETKATAPTSTSSAKSGNNTNAILAWLFAPITSLIWMNDEDEYLRWHAKQSLYWGLASIIVYVGGSIIAFILSFILIGFFVWCLISVWMILDIVVRIMGIVKANNGEKWEVPVVSKMFSGIIK